MAPGRNGGNKESPQRTGSPMAALKDITARLIETYAQLQRLG